MLRKATKRVMAVAAILSLAACLFFVFWNPLVNYIAQRFLLVAVSERLGGTATLDSIHTSMFPPRIEVQGLKVEMKSGPLREFSVREVWIRPGLAPAFLGEIRIEKIVVREPFFRFDLTDTGKAPKKRSPGPIRIPKATDLIDLKIESLEVQEAKLGLTLPGQSLEIEVSEGHASYQSGGSSEVWGWRGRGEILRKDRKLSLDDVEITAERDGDSLKITDFRLRGLGLDASMHGPVFPKADLELRMDADLAKARSSAQLLGMALDLPEVSGSIAARAKASGAWEGLALSGSVSAKELRFGDRKFAALASEFSIDRNAIRSFHAKLSHQGVSLDVTARGISKGNPGTFEIQSDGMPFETIETSWIDPTVTTPTLKGPLNLRARGKIGLAPFVLSGDYEVTSPGLRLNFEGGLGVFLPIRFDNVRAKGALGWSAERNFFLDNGEVTLNGVQGKYQFNFPKDGNVNAIWLGNVNEVGALFDPAMKISGSGQVTGGLSMQSGGVEANIHLNLETFREANRENLPLTGAIVFQPGKTLLRGFELQGLRARATVDAEFPTQGPGGFLKAKLSDFDLGPVADITARMYSVVDDIEGTGNAEIYLTDFNADLEGTIELESKSARWSGVPLDDVSLTAEFGGGEIRFPRARLSNRDGLNATASGKIGREAYEGLTLAVSKLPLAFFGLPNAALFLADSADAKVTLAGSFEDPNLSMTSQLFRKDDEGGFSWAGIASTSGPLSRLSWSLNLDGGTLDATGTVNALDVSEIDLRVALSKYALSPFFKQVPSSLTASMQLHGDLRRADSWSGQAYLQAFEVKNAAGDLKLRAPVMLYLSQGAMPSVKVGFDTDTTRLDASIARAPEGRFYGDLQGAIPLSVLTMFKTGIARAEGRLSVDLRYSTEPTGLKAAGSFASSGALLQFVDFPHDLRQVDLRGTLDQGTVYVDDMLAELEGGKVRAGGRLALPSEADPQGQVYLSGTVDHASFRFPVWLPINASGTVSLVGPLTGPTLKGDFVLHEARYEDEWDWKSKILTFGSSAAASRIHRAEEENIHFDLHFVTQGDRFALKNNIAQGKMRADVRLVGSDRKMGLLGKVEVVSGEVEFLENRFELTSGIVTFDKSDDFHPVFDLTAKTRVQQTDIFLDIRTENDDIVAFLSSQPLKDETNLIALLTLGVDSDELLVPGQGSGNVSGSVLPGVLSAPVQSKLQKGLKETRVLDTLQFVPFFSEQTQTNGLRMIVGKELFPKVKLLYSTDLFNVSSENTVRLEQSFNDHVSLQGSVRDNRQNQNEELDFGVDFEFRFDF